MKAPFVKQERILPPEGTFIARVIKVIYIGTIKGEYMGQENEKAELWITWELPTETHVFKEGEEAKPFVISRLFTHSMGKKSNLRPIVQGIIGTSLTDEEAYAFDHDELLGLPCQVTITYVEKNGATYANVTAVSALIKGIKAPEQVNESKLLSFEKWDQKYFDTLPQFIKDKIVSSKEYKNMKGIKEEEVDLNDIF